MMYQYYYSLILSLLFILTAQAADNPRDKKQSRMGDNNSGLTNIIYTGGTPEHSNDTILPATFGGKLKLTALIASGGYFYFLYHILATHSLLDESERWHQWQSGMPLPTLLAQSIDRLKPDLHQAIIDRANEMGIIDAHQGYRLFCEEINHEIEQLQKFVWTVDTLKKNSYVAALFPLNTRKIREARDAYHKLLFMKSIGKTLSTDGWLAADKAAETTDT